MNIKEQKVPIKIQKLEALNRRIPPYHPEKTNIVEELSRRRAGHYGEKSLNYHLSFLDEKKYHILHGLRLLNTHNHYFQMDNLLANPHFLTIIEVKNHSGTLIFDEHRNQLIQQINEKEKAYQDPIAQVKRHQLQLKEWLKQNKFPDIPIQTLIIVSNPSTIIKTIGNSKSYQQIIHSSNLIFKMQKFEEMYNKEILTSKGLTKLTRLLLKKHTPETDDVVRDSKWTKEIF